MQVPAAADAVSQAPARKSMTCAVCGLEARAPVVCVQCSRLRALAHAYTRRSGVGAQVLFYSFGSMLEGTPLWEFAEEGYFSVDAFSQGRRRPLLLGAKCSACLRDVCVASTCSVYQTRRLCVRCATLHKPET